MNWLEWVCAIFNPCVHQWETVTTLKDNEEHPTVLRMVRQCAVCGAVKNVDIQAPNGPPPHRHTWETIKEVRIVDDVKAKIKSVEGWVFTQKCSTCGEIRTVDTADQRQEQREAKKKAREAAAKKSEETPGTKKEAA